MATTAILLVLSSAACQNGTNRGATPSIALPPRELVGILGTINANAALLNQAIWSNNISVKARIVDDEGREHAYNLDGSLLFRRPRSLRIDLRPGLGEQVMQIGSNDESYWLWIEPEQPMMRWGFHRHSGKPCAGSMPVRPDQLAIALGLSMLPTEADGLIGPARRYGRNVDILYYLRPTPGAFRIDREYWIEREPPYQIRVVNFRDDYGRVVTTALLSDHRPVWEGGPIMPHEISIEWPLEQGRFTITSMGQVRSISESGVKGDAFDRPTDERLPSAVRTDVLQIDGDCEK